jgi:hypothetical protein
MHIITIVLNNINVNPLLMNLNRHILHDKIHQRDIGSKLIKLLLLLLLYLLLKIDMSEVSSLFLLLVHVIILYIRLVIFTVIRFPIYIVAEK